MASFQLPFRHKPNSSTVVHDHGTDIASSDEGFENISDNDGVAPPFCVSWLDPPELSSKMIEGKMSWQYTGKWRVPVRRLRTKPNVDAIREIAQEHYHISGLPNDDITVAFLNEGWSYENYTISSTDVVGNLHQCIFHCIIPVGPWYVLQSEVATMEFVRRNTKKIPIPKVFAFDSSMDNPLGLEWMLMEKINGRPYREVEDDLHFDAKAKIHRQAAEWMDELSRLRFDSIGNLYHDWRRPLIDESSYKVGPYFMCGAAHDYRLDYGINHGPFTSLEAEYRAALDTFVAEALDPRQRQRIEAWNKQKEMEAAGQAIKEKVQRPRYDLTALDRILQVCLSIQNILPAALDGKSLGPGSTSLHHQSISKNNILVDDAGNAVALHGWSGCCITIPNKIPRYPRLITVNNKAVEPELWDSKDERDEECLGKERPWEEVLLLKREFDRRLEELDSPHLRNKLGYDYELTQLDTLIACIVALQLEDLDQNPWLQSMRDKMRKIF